ncbi:hypothetical protein CTI12_AA472200 [Artemisia annua]|uniref:Zinc knuckle CX2CX4HX4C n=1 Tax=Artemisia annua TaxID=35608 RepID=A0A2U1LLI0_ARTAN|nr:hypothetical protein CTI12_AA472200 [Artemisia annua]
MDRMTTSICEKPYGRASFARVLVEIDSKKALVDNVELWYESLGKILRIRVEYAWVPPRCEECKVYGHYTSECVKKVNTVSKVNKDGENVKNTGKEKDYGTGLANNGDGEEGWQTATNRRNNRSMGYNTRQGSSGGYNGRGGISNNRGAFNYRGNQNTGNTGTRDVSKKPEPVNNGNVGKVDESVVMNDRGQNVNKGKSKVNENGTSNTGKSNKGSNNDKEATKVNKSDKSKKDGNAVSTKDVSGAKNVATSNRFDLLRDDNACEEVDTWKEVKESVVVACNTCVPIAEDVLKGWNADMIKFYSVKWTNRAKNSGHVKQQLDNEMKSLVSQIVQLNRNLNKNSKLNAEKLLKESVVANQNVNDVSFARTIWDNLKPLCKLEDLSHIWAEIVSDIRIASCADRRIVVVEVRRLCTTGTDPNLCAGFWSCNKVFDRGDVGGYNRLCTTENWTSFCAGLLFGCLEVQHAMHYRTESEFLRWLFCFDCGDADSGYGCCSWSNMHGLYNTGLHKFNVLGVIGGILGSLLCTTEVRVAPCAGHRLVVWEDRWLCTTGTDLNFCAGNLFWFISNSIYITEFIPQFGLLTLFAELILDYPTWFKAAVWNLVDCTSWTSYM